MRPAVSHSWESSGGNALFLRPARWTSCRSLCASLAWCYSYQAAPGPTSTIEYKYQECGAYQLCSLRAQSRGVRTSALGGARGPPGAGAGAACAHRPRARSSASVAAQTAVRPARVRVGRVVKHVPARAAGRPAGAADRARPEAARVLVRLALLNVCHTLLAASRNLERFA